MVTRALPPDCLKTPICERLGIEYPVFQAGMGMVAHATLAAAVSEAGGLGVVGAGTDMEPEALLEQVRIVRSLTAKPFGVDILFGAVQSEGGEVACYADNVEGLARAVLEERVPVLISGLGSPRGVVPEAHRRGIVVMSVVGAVRHAVKAAHDGVDAVIASGSDGGGHVGRVGTAVLIPAVVDAVDIPVLAGGGLADGRGLAAALALGAQGVWLGTRFIATEEAQAHARYKERITEIGEEGTVVSRAHSGKPCRMIRNDFTDYWAEREGEIGGYPLQAIQVGTDASRRGRLEGDVDNGVLPAGQSVGLIRQVEGAGEVVRSIVREAEEVIGRLGGGSRVMI